MDFKIVDADEADLEEHDEKDDGHVKMNMKIKGMEG